MSVTPSSSSTLDQAETDPVISPVPAKKSTAPSDQNASDRISATLENLERLCHELDDDNFGTQPNYTLPTGFVLSIVIPVFNEAQTLLPLLSRVRCLPIPKQIVIVDDHSTDGSTDMLREIECLPDVLVLFKPKNEGKGAALRSGFRHATGDIVAVQDADLEYDPRDILPLLQPILAGEADVVYGSRFLQYGMAVGSSFVHRFGNGFLTSASNFTTGLQLTDMETCYKVFRRNVVHQIEIKQNRFGFEPEITAKIARRGLRITERPVNYQARRWAEGKKIGFKDLLNALYCVVRYGFAD